MSSILKWIFKQLAKKSLPIKHGEMYFEGLKGKVEIIRDKWGIAHIEAKNEMDVYFAQGFVHAQERLWQMELYRRSASGRLSEILGDSMLQTDKTMRTLGFRRNGKKDYGALNDRVQKGIRAYVKGVNAWLHHPDFSIPLEFKLLRFKPESWSVEDSMAFGKLMQFQLSGQFGHKIYRAMVKKILGEEKMKQIDPHYGEDLPSVLPHGIEFNIFDKDGNLKGFDGPFIRKGGASNGWTISGKLTETGMPIHCNDPHLEPSLPSIWYAAHLKCEEFNVIGVGPPSLPMILIGHNDFYSWGFTVANVDAEDLFIEKLNPEDSNQYEYRGEWIAVKERTEKIKIKGCQNPEILKIKSTKHGPIISDLVKYTNNLNEDRTEKRAICLKSTALEQDRIFDGIYRMNKAQSWDQFIEGVKLIGCPQQNITYADIEGNIGSYICGKVPVRKNGDGSLPVPGWDGEYDWVDEIPFEEMPHCLNPQDGYIITANNRPIDAKDYPHFLSNTWDPGYRAQRIHDLIKEKNRLSIDDMKKIQQDVKSLEGLTFLNVLRELDFSPKMPDSEGEVRKTIDRAWDIYMKWDGEANAESVGACINEVFALECIKTLLYPVLGKNLGDHIIGQGFHPLLQGTTARYHGSESRLMHLLKNPDSWWIQEAGGINTLLTKSFLGTIEMLREKLGDEIQSWKWGKLNKITYPHSMAIKKVLAKVFNKSSPIGGTKHTILQMGSALDDFSVKHWAPSYRQIVDLSDFNKSWWIYSPGQSGNLASPHYDDLFDKFVKGEYIPMLWDFDKIKGKAKEKLVLTFHPS